MSGEGQWGWILEGAGREKDGKWTAYSGIVSIR